MQKSKTIAAIASNRSIAVLAGLLCLCWHTASGAWSAPDSLPKAGFGINVDSSYEVQKRRESAFYDETNPLSMIFVGLINIYQRVFSDQEGLATCQFRPSCSHYASTAIKKHGIIQGTLMTGDRLLRCNPWARGKYPLWQDNVHLNDPLEDHGL